MTDQQNNPADNADDKGQTKQVSQGQFTIQQLYLKDASFESPSVPGIFDQDWDPKVNLNLRTVAKKVTEDGVHEVVLTVTVTVNNGEEVAYLAEVQQAGLFVIAAPNDAALQHLLAVFCPTALYPFAREAISNLVSKGGFPQLNLAPVNFDALVRKNAAKRVDDEVQEDGGDEEKGTEH